MVVLIAGTFALERFLGIDSTDALVDAIFSGFIAFRDPQVLAGLRELHHRG